MTTAACLINRSPNSSIEFKCPESKWSERDLNLSHLRVFGCAAYADTSDGKLEPMSIKCVLLGYQEGTKGYRLWDRTAPGVKIIGSRDVICNEGDFPCKSTNNDAGSPSNNETQLGQPNITPIEVEATSIQLEVNQSKNEPAPEEETIPNAPDQDEGETGEAQYPLLDELQEYQLARDRTRREIRPPTRYSYAELIYTALLARTEVLRTEPESYSKAITSKDRDKWWQAMTEEMNSLKVNGIWSLVPKPKNQKVIQCKWLYKIKEGITTNEPLRYKARLVAKGYTQREAIDFNEVFSPVVKYKTIRMMLSIVAHQDLELEQLDVKTAFLQGDLEKQIFMVQPVGFVDNLRPDHVCKLHKSLYGLKQSPIQWCKRFDTFIINLGFTRSKYDNCFYFALKDAMPIYLLFM